MSIQFENFSSNVQAFVPRDMPLQSQPSSQTPTHQRVSQQMSYKGSPTSQVYYGQTSAQASNGGFSDYSSHMVAAMAHQQKQQKLNYQHEQNSGAFTPNNSHSHQVYQPATASNYGQQARFVHQSHYQHASGFVDAARKYQQPQMQTMPEFKMNFHCATSHTTQQNFQQRQSSFLQPPMNAQHVPYSSTRKVQSEKMAVLPLGKVQQQAYFDASSPVTNSTAISSQDSHFSEEDMNELTSEMGGFDSPVSNLARKQSTQNANANQQATRAAVQAQPQSAMKTANAGALVKTENGWKKKVKTELCRFWLNGQQCENSQKEQGCGFAHGQDELQKKKGLSRQYLTSVCKNFLDHPSKCTYGQRCIFQHPTHDVRKRQNYTAMIKDNARYTAMRLFQDIEGSEVIYINTYAATAPRLTAFRAICSSVKDNGDDLMDSVDDIDEAEISVPVFSRDQFHNAQH